MCMSCTCSFNLKCIYVAISTYRFVLCLALCYYVLVLFSPFSIAITSLREEKAGFGAFRAFVRFALVCFCLFTLPLGVWDGLRFVIVHSLDFSLTPFLSCSDDKIFFIIEPSVACRYNYFITYLSQ